MAYEFQKLSEVEALSEVPEGASVLAEVNGDIKRVPGSGLGGSGVKTAIIKSSDYDDTISAFLNPVSPSAAAVQSVTYECINMTFEEAYETMASGEPLSVIGMIANEACIVLDGLCAFGGIATFGVPCIMIALTDSVANIEIQLYWSANGLSTEPPIEK